jgi:L-asparagine transporter-like permease
MKIVSILQYLYLVFAALFFFDMITKWNSDRNAAYLSLFFSVLAVAMFFFRKKYKKRFHDRGKL